MLHENATQNTDHNIISKNVTSGKKLFLFVVFQIAFTALIFYLKSSSFGVAIDLLNSENCLEILQREREKSVGGRNQTDCAGLCHCNQMRNIDVGADRDIPPRKIKHLYEQGIEVALGNTRTNEFNLSRSWNAHEPKFDPLAEILEQSKSLISNCVGLQGSFLCGIVQCWDKNNNSIDSQCTPFFHFEPDIISDKEARYFRKDVSDQHQEQRNFHSDKVMNANRFSMVLDFYCYGAGHAVYESLTDCFVKSLVVLVPLLESTGSSKLPAVAVVSGFKLKYMEVLCRFLETRTRHLTFFLVEAQQHQIANEGLVCLAGHHVAETALELDPGFLPWYIHAPALDEVDPPCLHPSRPKSARLCPDAQRPRSPMFRLYQNPGYLSLLEPGYHRSGRPHCCASPSLWRRRSAALSRQRDLGSDWRCIQPGKQSKKSMDKTCSLRRRDSGFGLSIANEV